MLLEICSFPDELTTILFLSLPSRYVTPLHSAHLDLLVPSNSLSGLQKFSPGARCKSDLLDEQDRRNPRHDKVERIEWMVLPPTI